MTLRLSGFSLPTIRNIPFALFGIIVVEVSIFTIAWKIRKPKFLVAAFWLFVVLSFGISRVVHAVAYENNFNYITSITPHLPFYIPITSHKNSVKYGGLLPFEEPDSGDTKEASSLYYPLTSMKYK
jgi:membrane-anchored protein YejM (alkaline phosphatase superfamily)